MRNTGMKVYFMRLDGTKLIHDEIRNKCKLEFSVNGKFARTKISIKSMRILLRDLPFEEL